MALPNVLKALVTNPVIPAPRTIDDFRFALSHSSSPSIILLFGDISTLPEMLALANQYQKRLLIHLDLLEGVGKDKAGVKFLAQAGVTAMITTKSHLAKVAREEGMVVIQRVFLMDSEALRHGINTLKNFRPDALEVLPASIPASTVQQLIRETGLPILAGGLLQTKEDVKSALKNGIFAVSTSSRELWQGINES
ncbi:MAG: glycerol-3-phosphate responsive antiterminator [Negativicutes bacterium]|nr:glycerol-3-phosphate responsive antiterminator [Negativicutes bacterium]